MSQTLRKSLADCICQALNRGMSCRDVLVYMDAARENLIDHAAKMEIDDHIEFKETQSR